MNKVEPRTLSGFLELLPEEQILFNNLKEIIENTYQKYGFLPLDTPVIEYSNVLLAKAGGETEKQIYRFNKGDNDLSLRFDLTVPLAKFVAKNYNDLIFPFKRYQIGKVYRGERSQKGRFREFYQCDIDIIGDETLDLLNDAQIPCVMQEVFTKMNIGKFTIRMNNRKILNGLFEELNLKEQAAEILREIDKIDKIGKDKVKEILLDKKIEEKLVDQILDFIEISGTTDEKIEALFALNIKNETFKLGIEEIKTVVSYMRNLGMKEENFMLDLTIARGLDYYTGTVYETVLNDYPSIGSICSGGRFDSLAEFYTDKKLPGVGMSIGLTRLFYQLREAGIISVKKNTLLDVLLIPMTDNLDYVLEIAKKAREKEIKIDICDIAKNTKQKFKYANRIKVGYVGIIGDDEIKENKITLKNMETGEQEALTIEEFANTFSKKIR